MSTQSEVSTASPKVAYLFPGQGTQRVGMGKELYESSASARLLFQEIDEALDFPLTRFMFDGPEEELTKTVNAQPAIMAVSLACLRSMEETLKPAKMLAPAFVAGHSLGEYTSLVAANVLSIPDAVRLVRERGRLMQEAGERHPGGMAAILGLDELTVEEVCRETGARISNINAQDQIVIAGDRVALARAMDLASIRGATRLIPLQVSGAFHTPMMASATEGMERIIQELQFQDPVIPIIANCTARPLTTAKGIKTELLRQLCNCVQWQRSVTYMLRSGVGSFYEIGPGRVLASLIKRTDAQIPVVNIGDFAAIQALAS